MNLQLTPRSSWWQRLHTRYALLADSAAFFVSTASSGALGFLFWVIAARLYPAESVGLASALISAMFLLGNISRLGLDYALVVALPREASQKRRDGMILASFLLVGGMGIIAGFAFAVQPIFAVEATSLLWQSSWLLLGFVLSCSAWGVGLVLEPLLLVSRYGQHLVSKNLAFSVVKLVALVLLLPLVGERFGILVATALGVVAGLFVVWLRFRKRLIYRWALVRNGLAEIRSLATSALGHYFSTLISGLPNWLLALLVVERLGSSETAYFYTSWMIMTVVNTGAAALGNGLLAEGARQGKASRQLLSQSYRYMLLFMAPATVAVLLAAQYILPIFGPDYAEGGTQLLRYLALAGIPYGVVQINFMKLRVDEKLRVLTAASTLLSTIVLVGSYILLPTQGLTAIGYTWLLSCSLTAILSLWLK